MLSFHFLDSVFSFTKDFHFDEVQFIFSVVACAFDVISKKTLLNPKLQRSALIFTINFTVLALIFKSSIHFDLIFVYVVR